MLGVKKDLLGFKQGFTNPNSSLFSSWVVEQDCCKWSGIRCNNITGHVVALDLHREIPNDAELLQGKLNDSLLDLPFLSYLDLSGNDFSQIRIPQFICSLNNLEYLNLSHANFKGPIPDHLGNLSHLHSLDLNGNDLSLVANSLDWLHDLPSLKVLDLGRVDLSSAKYWLKVISMLPSLVTLRLSGCRLPVLPSSLPYANFTSLEILDLSVNNFKSPIPHWLLNVSPVLAYLNLARCNLQGHIPDAFGNMSSLIVIDLSENDLKGGIPTSLGLIQGGNELNRHSLLRELYLSGNQLSGPFEQSLSQLSNLAVLDVAGNSFKGVITETQLLNFDKLRVLNLSSNSLVFKMRTSWVPSFHLDIIGLRSCQLGPGFPEWLRTEKDFLSIDISDAGISDIVPDWFWNLSTKVKHMDLSSNFLQGRVPNLSSKLYLSKLNLRNNSFNGPLPHFSPNMMSLRLAENNFSGSLSPVCESMVGICSLVYLHLSENNISGPLPDCWTSGKKLKSLHLGYNSLYGKVPDSIGHLPLEELHLNNNILFGELPSSMKNCRNLVFMDLGHNKLSGSIPEWIGEMLQNLLVLALHSNKFHGTIPLQLCQLKSLKILSLS